MDTVTMPFYIAYCFMLVFYSCDIHNLKFLSTRNWVFLVRIFI